MQGVERPRRIPLWPEIDQATSQLEILDCGEGSFDLTSLHDLLHDPSRFHELFVSSFKPLVLLIGEAVEGLSLLPLVS